MSDLQAICDQVRALADDMTAWAGALEGEAAKIRRELGRAQRTLSRSGDGQQAAAAMDAAVRRCQQAAASLLIARSSAAGFVAAHENVGMASTDSPTGPAARSTGSRSSTESTGSSGRGDEPELGEGLAYSDVSHKDLVGSGGISRDIPRQGALGDCYLIASICAVADAEPETIAASIVESDGGVLVKSESVSRRLPGPNGATYGGASDDSLWVGLLEKAYANANGGYPSIGQGAWPSTALEWLTGRKVDTRSINTMTDHDLVESLTCGRAAVVSSFASDQGSQGRGYRIPTELFEKYDVVGPHAYAIVSVSEGSDGVQYVNLHNPWGSAHPEPIPLNDFRRLFHRLDVATATA